MPSAPPALPEEHKQDFLEIDKTEEPAPNCTPVEM